MAVGEFIQKLRAAGKDYQLTRFVILRFLGFIYAIAFLVAANQLVPLIGEHGLTPVSHYLERLQSHFGSRTSAISEIPTLFWFGHSDQTLLIVAWIGFGLSVVVLAGYANAILMSILWAMYLSIVHVGQIWYSYGWETQLTETGFLAIFLCPFLDPRPFPKRPPPILVIWLFRWLGFRIMIGAGLIKIRGDSCWRDLTCLYYHYQTQPIPNPVSRYIHFAPHWFHNIETAWNHFIELVVPWFSFGPRVARHIAGVLLISFQIFLIISGNLSFLNYLTIIPFLACLDDTFWEKVLPHALVQRCSHAAARRPGETDSSASDRPPASELLRRGRQADGYKKDSQPSLVQFGLAVALTILVAYLSITPVLNLLSPGQVMNSSFDRFNLVNTYGAFGSVGKERNEIIFEGTDSLFLSGAEWKEYEFKAKPGDPNRRPAFVAPYQPRIDWQIWFAAMETPGDYPWTFHFVWKLLHNDPGTLSLIATNPFSGKPPHYIRARLYRYKFTPLGENGWWKRELIGEWLPPLSADDPDFRRVLSAMGWLDK